MTTSRNMLAQHLLGTYGPRLTMDELAKVLRLATNTIYNQVSAGTFGVKTYMDGKQRWADYRDVVRYLDAQRAKEEA